MYPYCVDRGQRFYFVIKVKELVSVHEYPEPLVLAVDLNLKHGRETVELKQSQRLANPVFCRVKLLFVSMESGGCAEVKVVK